MTASEWVLVAIPAGVSLAAFVAAGVSWARSSRAARERREAWRRIYEGRR